jgi:hypothetical protein
LGVHLKLSVFNWPSAKWGVGGQMLEVDTLLFGLMLGEWELKTAKNQ